MHKSKLFKYALLLAVMLALTVFGVALAEGEPTGIDSPDCAGKITVKKITSPSGSSDMFQFTANRQSSSSPWKTFQLNGVSGTNIWNWSPSSMSDFGRIYTVTETIDPTDPWILTGVSCSAKYNSNPITIPINVVIAADGKSGSASFTFEDYYYVTCSFTNTAQPDMDYGDLPEGDDPYDYNMTTFANNGARHIPGALFLGASVDAEPDGQPTQLATGDDDNNDDEDGGVRAANPEKWIAGEGAVNVTVGGTGTGCLSAWMDIYNSDASQLGADGDFDDSGTSGSINWSEKIISNELVTAGQTYTFTFNLPPDSGTYNMYSRFRLVPENGDGVCGSAEPTGNSPQVVIVDDTPQLYGLVTGGEVEDYVFAFDPTAVSLQSFSAIPFKASTAVLVSSVLGLGLLGVFFSARKKS